MGRPGDPPVPGADHSEPSESSPLLAPSAAGASRSQEPTSSSSPAHELDRPPRPARLYRTKVLVILFIVLLLIELGTVIIMAPVNAILEDNICRDFIAFHDTLSHHNSTAGPGMLFDDPRCKVPDVQGKLAMVRGWQMALDAIPSIIGAIPYGLMADMYGRKPILILGLLGYTLSVFWIAIVLALPSVFPLGAIYFSSAFMLIGAFGSTGPALLFTCLADVTPQAARATVFFRAMVAYLVAEMAGSPVSAWLLSYSPWLAMIVGLLAICGSLVMMCFTPETLGMTFDDDGGDSIPRTGPTHGRPASILSEDSLCEDEPLVDVAGKTADPADASPLRRTLTLVAASFRELWVFVIGNRRLVVLMIPLCFFLLGRLAQELLLQYATKRYGITWSDATVIMTVRSLSNLILYLAVFPALSRVCLELLSMSSVQKDLSLARFSGGIGVLGALLVAASPTPLSLMFSLVLFSFGYGFAPFIRSLLNALVEQRHLAMLNTCIGFLELCATLVAAPGLSVALDAGVRLGGPWVGLPFLLAALGFAVATGMVCAFRLPPTERPSSSASSSRGVEQED